jgi:hypothetical protein
MVNRRLVAGGVLPTTLKWLWPVVLEVLLIVALLWFANTNSSPVDRDVNTAALNASSQASNAASSAGSFVKSSIPGGVDLNIPQNGMESELLVFIKDPNARVSRETWFAFDRLNFDTGFDASTVFLARTTGKYRENSESLSERPRTNLWLHGQSRRCGSQLEVFARSRE